MASTRIAHWLLGTTRHERREGLVFLLFITPWIVGFLVFTLGPMMASFILSFTRYDITTPPVFIGVSNYTRAFSGPLSKLFWHSLRVTIVYSCTSIPLRLIFGFMLAMLLNSNIPAVSLWRTFFYLPSVLSGVAVAVLWMLVFEPYDGVINRLLALVGIEGPMWIYSKEWALPSLIIMSLWGVGGAMIIYLSALQGIPTALYEAATIDGAGAWVRFWSITVPLMTPIIFFNLVMGVIGSLQSFTSAYVMTGGGPQNATLFYSLQLYNAAFRDFRMGWASMLAWILFIIILCLTALIFKTSSAWVYYESEVRK